MFFSKIRQAHSCYPKTELSHSKNDTGSFPGQTEVRSFLRRDQNAASVAKSVGADSDKAVRAFAGDIDDR